MLVNPHCKYLGERQTIRKLRVKSSWLVFFESTLWLLWRLRGYQEIYYQVMTDYDSEGHDTDTETNISGNVSFFAFIKVLNVKL